MGDSLRRVAIGAVVVPIIGSGICVSGVWVGVCPSEVDGCVPSKDDINLSELVPLPSDAPGAFPIIFII